MNQAFLEHTSILRTQRYPHVMVGAEVGLLENVGRPISEGEFEECLTKAFTERYFQNPRDLGVVDSGRDPERQSNARDLQFCVELV